MVDQVPNSSSTWTTISGSPEYQSLSDDQQEATRISYFNKVVAPARPENIDAGQWRNQFLDRSMDTDQKNGIITDEGNMNDRSVMNGRVSNISNTDYAKSIGMGAVAATAKAAGGLGEAGTYPIEAGANLVGATNIAQSAKNARTELGGAGEQAEQYMKSAPSPGAAKAGEYATDIATALGSAGETGIGAIDAGIEGLTGKGIIGAGAKMTAQGMQQGAGMGVEAGATQITNPNESAGQSLAERANTGIETAGINTVAAPLTGAVVAGTKMISDLAMNFGGWAKGLMGNTAAGTASAEKSVGKSLVVNAGPNATGQDVANTIDTNMAKYQGTGINAPTTAVLPQTQNLARVQSNATQNVANEATTQAKQALVDYAQIQHVDKSVEQGIGTPEQANSANVADVVGGEAKLNVTEKANYENIQKPTEQKVQVDPEDLATKLSETQLTGVNPDYVVSAIDKIQRASPPLSKDIFKDFGLNFEGIDPNTKSPSFTATTSKYPITLDKLTTASQVLDQINKVPHEYGLNADEQQVVKQLGQAFNAAKQSIVEAQPADVQKQLTAGDTYFKENVLPLRQQELPRNKNFGFTETNPAANQAGNTSVTNQSFSRQTINRIAGQEHLEGKVTDIPFNGDTGGQNAEDLIRQNSSHIPGILDRIQADIASKPNQTGMEDALNTDYARSMDAIKAKDPKQASQLEDWYTQYSKNQLLKPNGIVNKLDDNGKEYMDRTWLNEAITPGTKASDTVQKLWGNDPDIQKVLDMGRELGYNAPTSEVKGEQFEHVVKAAAYASGIRYGTIGEATRVTKEMLNESYAPVVQRALTDPAYAKQLALAYKKADYGKVVKFLQDANVNNLVGATYATGQSNPNYNNIDTDVSGAMSGNK